MFTPFHSAMSRYSQRGWLAEMRSFFSFFFFNRGKLLEEGV